MEPIKTEQKRYTESELDKVREDPQSHIFMDSKACTGDVMRMKDVAAKIRKLKTAEERVRKKNRHLKDVEVRDIIVREDSEMLSFYQSHPTVFNVSTSTEGKFQYMKEHLKSCIASRYLVEEGTYSQSTMACMMQNDAMRKMNPGLKEVNPQDPALIENIRRDIARAMEQLF